MTGSARPAARRGDAWLDGLALRVRGGMGERPGERRFPGRPQAAGVEIEGHAAYAPGDDLRHLDWTALGRLDALLVRRFTAEREVQFHVLLDASASMGVPPAKLDRARELAAALARVALGAGDALRVAVLGAPGTAAPSPVFRARGRLPDVAALLARVEARAPLDLGEALAGWAARRAQPGAALVISDFLAEPAVVARGVLALRARRFEVVLLHVLAREEADPALGAGVLVDAETGASHPVALTPALRTRYRALLDAHLAALAALATRAGAFYARLVTDEPLESFFTGELARQGLVRRR